MPHPDEGTIQALLDGELDSAEQARVEAHIAGCQPCARRLAAAREFMSEADRLVEVLQVPDRPAAVPARPRRRAMLRNLAWAASIVVAAGLGYWGRGTIPTRQSSAVEGELAANAPVASTPAAKATDEAAVPAEQKTQATGGDLDRLAPTTNASRDAAPSAPIQAAGAAVSRANEAAPPPTAAEQEVKDARADAPATKMARTLEADGPTWRVISMEEAVRLLGGQIRLIDGLTADRVEAGPGTAVAGADPSLALVRVVYASGTVLLDQQRPSGAKELRQEAASGAMRAAAAPEGTGWQEREGLRFVVTGGVSPDSIRELARRVR